MWTGHWAPALILKTITPEVPLGLLFIAAALPDLVGFLQAVFGLYEYIELADYLPGTFRYVTYMPFSHSLLGNIALAFLVGFTYYSYSKSQVGATALFLACLSHFPMEIAQHRMDLRIFPTDKPSLGYGWFDSYLFTFFAEGLLIAYGYYYFVDKTAPVANDKQFSEFLTKCLGVALGVQHFLFSFNLVPTQNAQFVHAPMFVLQIIFTSLLAHLVDGLRINKSMFWVKAENVKRNLHSEHYMGKAVM